MACRWCSHRGAEINLALRRELKIWVLPESSLAEAIQEVMVVSRYRKNASEFSIHLKEEDPVATACELFERI